MFLSISSLTSSSQILQFYLTLALLPFLRTLWSSDWNTKTSTRFSIWPNCETYVRVVYYEKRYYEGFLAFTKVTIFKGVLDDWGNRGIECLPAFIRTGFVQKVFVLYRTWKKIDRFSDTFSQPSVIRLTHARACSCNFGLSRKNAWDNLVLLSWSMQKYVFPV